KPALERDIYKSGTDSVANFVGNEYSIINQADEKKHTYINTTLGAEVSLNNSFSINANIGAKLRNNEKIYNGTLGVKYKF
ncbi:autotransporter outer membrane beta-barrel domain-containing protein, partial [Campylobacter porcelli]|nr:autotransporter outer membrane beta-barrel domain-containing protein [Campylobacter sp. CX2-4855-23]